MNEALENLAALRLRISAKLIKEGYRADVATTELLVAQYVMAAATLMLVAKARDDV